MRVEIAGAGIIGLTIGWRLAQRGVAAVIRDAGPVAAQASWAGAGMLAPGGEFRSDSPWARRAVESLAKFGAFVDELSRESGITIDYRVCGAVEIAGTPEASAELCRSMERQRSLGIAVEPLTSSEARRRVPAATRAIHSAVWYPEEAIADPRDVCRALTEACRRRGVEIEPNHAVARPEPPAIIAAGAWSTTIAGMEEAPRAFPVKGHLLGYRLTPGSLGPIVRRGYHYALQRSNGFTIFGSDERPDEWDLAVDREAAAGLKQAAAALLPGLLDREPDEVWTGLRPGSATGNPVVEQVAGQNVWLAYGHYRNGILLAPITAEIIAASVTASLGKD